MSLRVTVVVTGLGIGGAEHALLNLLSRLDRTRFEVAVVVLGLEDALLPQYRAAGIEPVMLRMRPGRWPLRTARRLVDTLRELAPDIIQGWMYHGNLAASFAAARLSPRPVVCWSVRDTPEAAHGHSLFTQVVIRLSGWYVKRVDRIFNVSSRSLAYCAERFGWPAERTEVLPNGVDMARFRPDPALRLQVRAELRLADEPLIALVARWSPVKNHALFVAAAVRLRERCPRARFLLVGKGLDAANPELAGLLARSGLGNSALLLGPRHDVERLYAAADIAALTSHSEGFPNVLAEAMACGVPVTSTDVGDARQIVGPGGRVLVPDADVFAATWAAWLDAPSELARLGMAARDHIGRHYAIEAVAQRLQRCYEQLAAAREAA